MTAWGESQRERTLENWVLKRFLKLLTVADITIITLMVLKS